MGPSQDLTESLETEEDEEGSFLERQFPGSSGRSPYRLVYDVDCEDPITGEVGKWIKVEKKDCPLVFEDPHFLKHGYICNRDSSDLAVDCNSEFESMWSYVLRVQSRLNVGQLHHHFLKSVLDLLLVGS